MENSNLITSEDAYEEDQGELEDGEEPDDEGDDGEEGEEGDEVEGIDMTNDGVDANADLSRDDDDGDFDTRDLNDDQYQNQPPGLSLSETLAKQLEFLKGVPSKPRAPHSKAKAVECVDLNGNVIATFRSGAAARKALNVPQEEISLICRGLKAGVGGFTFRFAASDPDGPGDDDPDQDGEDGDGEDPDSQPSIHDRPHPSSSTQSDMALASAAAQLQSATPDYGVSQPQPPTGPAKRGTKAKPVECIDRSGNVVAQYRSQLEAAAAVGATHGEVSLACRGLKAEIKGLRFRFIGEDWLDPATVKSQKRMSRHGLGDLDGAIVESDRQLTRVSKYRGDVFSSALGPAQGAKGSIRATLAPAEVRVRSWRRGVPAGSRLGVPVWIPATPLPTPALQQQQAAEIKGKNMSNRKRKRLEKSKGAQAAYRPRHSVG